MARESFASIDTNASHAEGLVAQGRIAEAEVAYRELIKKTGNEPTIEELAQATGRSIAVTERLLAKLRETSVDSDTIRETFVSSLTPV